MFKRFTKFLSEMEKRNAPGIPAQIDRSHFMDATDPVEARLAQAICSFPPSELGILILSFGLDGRTPKCPVIIAEELGMVFFKVLDIGTGAELRLRNRKETRPLIEAIAGQEVAALARHIEVTDIMREKQRRKSANDVWLHTCRPLRRLAMSTALEGGFDAFVALVREGALAEAGTGMRRTA